jgi:hypothetical protein
MFAGLSAFSWRALFLMAGIASSLGITISILRWRIQTRDLVLADIFDYIEVFFTTGPAATVTSAASVWRPSNRPHREDRICLLSWVSPPDIHFELRK